MMPRAGGMYVYLKEAYGSLWGFLYGWTHFMVIGTATIAAVAVAFSRFTGILIPQISESSYIIEPVRLGSSSYAFSLSTAQLLGIVMIVFTFYGGIEAVIWVEVVQLVIYIGGAIAAAFVLINNIV